MCEDPEFLRLVFSIIKLDPISSAESIIKIVDENSKKGHKNNDEFMKNVFPELRIFRKNIMETEKYADFDFTDKNKFEMQYKQFFGNKPVRTYDDVCDFFAEDLKILKKFLIHASIPAIRMEKPFAAREINSLNKLLAMVNDDDYYNWINKNGKLFLPDEYEAINRKTILLIKLQFQRLIRSLKLLMVKKCSEK